MLGGFAHTPYGDGVSPFGIGLKPLDLAHWIEVDTHLDGYLAEKRRLDGEGSALVFDAEPETETAQREVLDLLISHLAQHHAGTHRLVGDTMYAGKHCVALCGDGPPLKTAGQLVQEDLVIMRRNGDGSGWRIAAASLHFPSSWSLCEKFGKALADAHAPVPGFARGTRSARIIDRIFDNLLVDQPVWRSNFSLYDNADLHHPWAKSDGVGHGYGHVSPDMVIRSEYQTLRKLPVSGEILFTIRIHLDAMNALACHPDRARLCDGLVQSLLAMDEAQLSYKGLDDHARDVLVEQLRSLP